MHVRPGAFDRYLSGPRLPGWPVELDGFFPLGFVSDDGIKRKSRPGDDLPAFGGRTAVLQDEYTVSFTGNIPCMFNTVMVELLFGRQAAAFWAFSEITPHWYLQGDV